MQEDRRPESGSGTTNAAETAARSALDKPLGQLTEEDIAQLTREDCRRFLKEKGMRRPSWNKSQAIQQVISLKALLEGRPDSGDHPAGPGFRQKPPPPPSVTPPHDEVGGDSPTPAKEPSLLPYRRRDPIPPVFFAGEPSCRFPVAVRDQQPLEIPSPSPRVPEEVPTGQMTIFYDGKVIVYNDVTADKARAIMLLAAKRDCYDAATQPEGPPSRKASLQRYLEKRKDRFKGKKTLGGPPSNMEMMYLSQKFRGQIPNEQLSQSGTSSPTQLRPPCIPTRCSPIEFQTQKHHISIDLNDDGGGK